MKNKNGMIGLGVFTCCLWVLVVTSYAARVGEVEHPQLLLPMQNSSCSSSSSSSGGSGTD